MTRRAAATAAALAVSGSLLLAVPASGFVGDASAESRLEPSAVFSDQRGDARRGIDITRVAVTKRASARKISVTLASPNFAAKRAQIADVYFDTRRRDAGPEYRIVAFSRKDPDSRKGTVLLSTERWAGGKRLRCGEVSAKFALATDRIRVAAPKGCLNRPKAVRVNATVWDVTDYTRNGWEGYPDYAPAKKRWYRWVR